MEPRRPRPTLSPQQQQQQQHEHQQHQQQHGKQRRSSHGGQPSDEAKRSEHGRAADKVEGDKVSARSCSDNSTQQVQATDAARAAQPRFGSARGAAVDLAGRSSLGGDLPLSLAHGCAGPGTPDRPTPTRSPYAVRPSTRLTRSLHGGTAGAELGPHAPPSPPLRQQLRSSKCAVSTTLQHAAGSGPPPLQQDVFELAQGLSHAVSLIDGLVEKVSALGQQNTWLKQQVGLLTMHVVAPAGGASSVRADPSAGCTPARQLALQPGATPGTHLKGLPGQASQQVTAGGAAAATAPSAPPAHAAFEAAAAAAPALAAMLARLDDLNGRVAQLEACKAAEQEREERLQAAARRTGSLVAMADAAVIALSSRMEELDGRVSNACHDAPSSDAASAAAGAAALPQRVDSLERRLSLLTTSHDALSGRCSTEHCELTNQVQAALYNVRVSEARIGRLAVGADAMEAELRRCTELLQLRQQQQPLQQPHVSPAQAAAAAACLGLACAANTAACAAPVASAATAGTAPLAVLRASRERDDVIGRLIADVAEVRAAMSMLGSCEDARWSSTGSLLSSGASREPSRSCSVPRSSATPTSSPGAGCSSDLAILLRRSSASMGGSGCSGGGCSGCGGGGGVHGDSARSTSSGHPLYRQSMSEDGGQLRAQRQLRESSRVYTSRTSASDFPVRGTWRNGSHQDRMQRVNTLLAGIRRVREQMAIEEEDDETQAASGGRRYDTCASSRAHQRSHQKSISAGPSLKERSRQLASHDGSPPTLFSIAQDSVQRTSCGAPRSAGSGQNDDNVDDALQAVATRSVSFFDPATRRVSYPRLDDADIADDLA